MPSRPRAGHHAAAERVPFGGGQVSGLSQREAGRLLTGAVQHIGFIWLCRNKVPQTRGLETRHFVSQLGRPESEVKVSAGPASQTLWAAPFLPHELRWQRAVLGHGSTLHLCLRLLVARSASYEDPSRPRLRPTPTTSPSAKTLFLNNVTSTGTAVWDMWPRFSP